MISKSQTLITGVYRCGSEFVSQLLNCHPQISVSLYGVNALRFIFDRYDPISENYLRAIDDLEKRLRIKYNQSLNKNDIIQKIKRCEPIDYGRFYDIAVHSLYMKYPAIHWAEKNQLLWREIPKFLDTMPDGKAIQVVRDPRSILLSFKHYTYSSPPAYLEAVFNCLDSMQYALKYIKNLPKDKFYCVKYEDIATNPKSCIEKIWNFLELEGVGNIEDQSNWINAFGMKWHANSSFHSNTDLKPFDVESSINRWKTGLQSTELSFVQEVCKDVMKAFDYNISKVSSNWLSIIKLFAHDDTLVKYFRNWILTGEGIEAFPNNPLNPQNWRDGHNKPYREENVK